MNYDVVVIGAGFSGLAVAVRAAMAQKKVLILEQHSIAGGLNSYYQRKGHLLDTGLHALTNFAQKGERQSTLGKILRQLRLPYELLEAREQSFSKVVFSGYGGTGPGATGVEIKFSNDLELLLSEVGRLFPSELDGMMKLISAVRSFPEGELERPYVSAYPWVKNYISDPLLINMIMMPLLLYGSSWPNDIDLSLFIILFRSIYLEGLFRPAKGIYPLIEALLNRLREENGEIRFQYLVKNLKWHENGDWEIRGGAGTDVNSGQESIFAKQVISSIGYQETCALLPSPSPLIEETFSFVESQFVVPMNNNDSILKPSIIFYNSAKDGLHYEKPSELWDERSSLFCFPEHFSGGEKSHEQMVRVTFLANSKLWQDLAKQDKAEYRRQKENVYQCAIKKLNDLYGSGNSNGNGANWSPTPSTFYDTFTPNTIERYTRHFGGAVYGGTQKLKDGQLKFGRNLNSNLNSNLYLCGTDQGLLGVIGSMMSGILIANRYIL